MTHHNTAAIKSIPIMKLPTAAGFFALEEAGFTGAAAGAAPVAAIEEGGAEVRTFPQESQKFELLARVEPQKRQYICVFISF
jgi:hypothetical protein